jgi:hypothetical protein
MRSYDTKADFFLRPNGDQVVAATQQALSTDWHYLSGTYDDTERILRIYVDGEPMGQQDVSATVPVGAGFLSPAEDLLLGIAVAGYLDELRLSAVKRDAPWIAATARVLSGGFATLGADETHCQ